MFCGMANYFVTLWKEEWLKPTRGRRRLQMLNDLYKNNSYEVLKRTAEDRSAWKESTRKKMPKHAVQLYRLRKKVLHIACEMKLLS